MQNNRKSVISNQIAEQPIITFQHYVTSRSICTKKETRANNSAASKQQSFCVCHSLSSFSAAVPLIVEGSKRGPMRASLRRA